MIYYISDLHFGHVNILRYDERPYQTIEEMDREIITKWNKKVTEKDDVYIVGDLSFRTSNEEILKTLGQLKGKLHMIIGNHDYWANKKNTDRIRERFESIDSLKMISDNGRKVVLCHYPMAEWNGMRKGAYHVYGHIHIVKNEAFDFMKTKFPYAVNACCAINNFTPSTLEELIENNKAFIKSGPNTSEHIR